MSLQDEGAVMKAVRIAALGHCSALGRDARSAGASLATRLHAAPAPPPARRQVLAQDWPWHPLALGETGWAARAEAAVRGVGAELRSALPHTLWADTPLFLASSSLQAGALEEAARASGRIDLPLDAAAFARQVADWLGLLGTPWVFSTTCTSGFAALDAAAGLIAAGEIDHAIVLGMELANDITVAGFSGLGLLAGPDAAAGNGLVLGEAVAGMLLCAADDPRIAADSGWRIAACELGVDGHSPTGPAPDGARIAAVLARTLAAAGLKPADIDLLKPHRGGLAATDEPEARALATLFGQHLPPQVALKPHLGHTLGACGVAESTALLAALAAGAGDARRVLLNLIGFGGSIGALALTHAGTAR
jgi:3-oxoacyl-[acyl-carrier-protein] synthase I